MINMIMIINFILLISFLLLFLNFILSKKSFHDREKMSPFECGFDPMSNNRIPFSIQFFMISLIFLIFDIEITLIIPLIYLMFKMNKIMILTMLFFLLILIMGIYIEYMEESIDWKF
uniref:NADH dehydrogenase subunit 3 n=1 Tax=Tapinoma ibericum TaxID=2005328 RepID=UPI002176CEED|nr:NADH dehydrogenase subunit 3 [Tapinoma ibericum]UUF93598.1 NADH dehydrogenase subunit 3 [Tapinoma ibericum]